METMVQDNPMEHNGIEHNSIYEIKNGYEHKEISIEKDNYYGIEKNGIKENGIEKKVVYLDGNTLTISVLNKLASGNYTIALSDDTWERIRESRKVVDDLANSKKVVYGINTGFGKFATVKIPNEYLEQLQLNLIRSHSAGVGKYLSIERVRMLFALRINVLAKGFSGISGETLERAINAFNNSCLPLVPEQGTVGASGDLAPLSHIVLGLLGEGKMWSPRTGVSDAHIVLKEYNLEPISLKPKEGLALINGTQFITALGAEAIEKAIRLVLQADVIAALTLDAVKGNYKAFDSAIHEARPHSGQIEVAARMRALLYSTVFPSKIYTAFEASRKVQDAYTLRCIPQVHGVVVDIINFAKKILTTEMNSATDNPMVLRERNELISGGNFHGEYPAKALDILAIGLQDLANMSERRIERLVNNSLSEGLPPFLVSEPGLNSGFMIAHCTAAALTSENKVLCHPSSIDTITTSSATEDHVSMGGWSARKALDVIRNIEHILAIELLASCQALEFLHANNLTTTKPLEAVYMMVRKHVKALDQDRFMAPDINEAVKLIQKNEIWKCVECYIEEYRNIQNETGSISCLLDY